MNALPAHVRQFLSMSKDEQLATCQRAIDSFPKCEEDEHEEALQDAISGLAAQLVSADELDELIGELRDAVPLLNWLAEQDIPRQHLSAFRALDRKARSLEKSCEELMERNA